MKTLRNPVGGQYALETMEAVAHIVAAAGAGPGAGSCRCSPGDEAGVGLSIVAAAWWAMIGIASPTQLHADLRRETDW